MSKIRRFAAFADKFIDKIGKDRVRAHSAEAAFFMIMSFFPLLMLLLTTIRYTPITVDQVIFTIEEITPFAVSAEIEPIINGMFKQSAALLPWTILVAVWTAGKGIIGLSDGLNSIYQITETKNYFVVRIRAACYTVVLILALAVSLGILVFGYNIQSYLAEKIPAIRQYLDEIVILPTAIALLLLVFLFTVLYTFLPNRRMPFLQQLPGAIFSAVSWAVFSYAFSIYLDFAGNMSLIYGSLTTLVVVMLWLYFCLYLLFIGAEINQYLDTARTSENCS